MLGRRASGTPKRMQDRITSDSGTHWPTWRNAPGTCRARGRSSTGFAATTRRSPTSQSASPRSADPVRRNYGRAHSGSISGFMQPGSAQVVILGAGRSVRGGLASAMVDIDERGRVMDWLLDAFAVLGEPDIYFVGGFKAEDVVERYPQVSVVFNRAWADTGPVESLRLVPIDPLRPTYVCYADVVFRRAAVEGVAACRIGMAIAVDSTWRSRYDGRGPADLAARGEGPHRRRSGGRHRDTGRTRPRRRRVRRAGAARAVGNGRGDARDRKWRARARRRTPGVDRRGPPRRGRGPQCGSGRGVGRTRRAPGPRPVRPGHEGRVAGATPPDGPWRDDRCVGVVHAPSVGRRARRRHRPDTS